jgi:hypothetical protein
LSTPSKDNDNAAAADSVRNSGVCAAAAAAPTVQCPQLEFLSLLWQHAVARRETVHSVSRSVFQLTNDVSVSGSWVGLMVDVLYDTAHCCAVVVCTKRNGLQKFVVFGKLSYVMSDKYPDFLGDDRTYSTTPGFPKF